MDALTKDFFKHQIMVYYKAVCRGDIMTPSLRHHIEYIRDEMSKEEELFDYVSLANQML